MLPDRKSVPVRIARLNESALVRRPGWLRKPTKITSPGRLMLLGFKHGGNGTPDTGAVRESHEAIVRYKTPHRCKCLITGLLRLR